MKEINVLSENHGYAYISGRLIECDVEKEILDRNEDNIWERKLLIAHADWTETIDPKDFFFTIDDFKNGNSCGFGRKVWIRSEFKNLSSDGENNYTYVINNGRVEKKDIFFTHIEVEYPNKDKNNYKLTSPDYPEECYFLEEDAKAHLSIDIVNADGTMKHVPSAASLITLTDDQRKVVDEITSLTKKAKEMGIVLVSDWCYSYAFNRNNLSDWNIEYESEEGFERLDVLSKEFRIPMDVCVTSDENMLNLKRKDE